MPEEPRDFEVSDEQLKRVISEEKVISDVVGILVRSIFCLTLSVVTWRNTNFPDLKLQFTTASIIFGILYLRLSYGFFISFSAYVIHRSGKLIKNSHIYNLAVRIIIIFVLVMIAATAFQITANLSVSGSK
ncbi:MAG: hypothetical protein CL534_06795 [Ahrensia sp.]|nr:hypothetical protein [Ahrensia sp.]